MKKDYTESGTQNDNKWLTLPKTNNHWLYIYCFDFGEPVIK